MNRDEDDVDQREPTPIADALHYVIKDLGAPPVDTMRSVFDDWAELVGASMAENVAPVSLRDGVLTVKTKDPTWAAQLKFLVDDLKTRINTALETDAISSIVVTVRAR